MQLYCCECVSAQKGQDHASAVSSVNGRQDQTQQVHVQSRYQTILFDALQCNDFEYCVPVSKTGTPMVNEPNC